MHDFPNHRHFIGHSPMVTVCYTSNTCENINIITELLDFCHLNVQIDQNKHNGEILSQENYMEIAEEKVS